MSSIKNRLFARYCRNWLSRVEFSRGEREALEILPETDRPRFLIQASLANGRVMTKGRQGEVTVLNGIQTVQLVGSASCHPDWQERLVGWVQHLGMDLVIMWSCHHLCITGSDKWCVVMSLLAISRKSGFCRIQSSDRILTTDFCFWLRYERGIKKLTRNRPWVLFFLVAAHRGHWKIQWKLNDSTNCN